MKKYISAVLIIPTLALGKTFKIEKIKVGEETKEETIQKKKLYSEEIKMTKQIDLGEILSNLYPEINHIRKGGTANDINIRGFSRDNINVLIDGENIYNACPNRMDPPIFHVSTPNVEKVIIKEGPFDVENQGSLAALVNIITEEPKKGTHFNAGATVGSFQYKQGYIQINKGNKSIKFLVGFQKRYSKPYKTGEGKKITEYKHPNPLNDYQDSQKNRKAFDIDDIWSSAVFTPNEDNKIKINFSYQNAKSVLYPYLLMDAVYDRTFRIAGEYNLKPLHLKIKLYYNKVKHDMQDRWRKSALPWSNGIKSNRGYMMRTYAKSSVKGFKIEKNHFFNTFQFKAGIDGFIRNWKADNVIMTINNAGMIPDVDIKDIGLFGEITKKVRKNNITAGIRADYTKSTANKDAYSATNKNLCYQYYNSCPLSKSDTYITGFLLDRYYVSKGSYIYAGVGHSVRVPDPQERYIALRKPPSKPDWVGNPNLKLTKNTEIDIGSKIKKFGSILSLNAFYSFVKDYIYIRKIKSKDSTKSAMSYYNVDARFYGFDFGAKMLITDTISIDLGAAYQRGKKDSGKDRDIAEVPPLKVRGALTYDNLKYYSTIEVIHAFKQDKVDSTLNETATPSYTVINLKAGYRVKNFSLGFGIDNIFDKFYYTHLSYLRNPFSAGMKTPEPGRFIYLNMNLTF